MRRDFDLVVIGGGSAGCVVAARASQDAGRRVLLVEAGPDPQPIPEIVADPARQAELVADPTYVRDYPTHRADGSIYRLVAGRVMGGGSSVNNLAAVRPVLADFEAWARVGGPAWSFASLLPTLRAMETDADYPDGDLHGGAGPLHLVRRFRVEEPLEPTVRALLTAAGEVGLPPCPDLNVPEPFGIGASTYNEVDGRRQSVAAAYLDPIRQRPNLTIQAETRAARLRLRGGRVVGVDLVGPTGREVVEADRVVLSAGVFGSPELLVASGIGPPPALERLGLQVVLPVPGIGANYQDHAVLFVAFAAGHHLRPETSLPKARLVARSRPGIDPPDLHLLVRGPRSGPAGGLELPVSVHLLDHRSRGRLTFETAGGGVRAMVDAALLRHPDDVRALLDGIELAARLAARPSLARLYGPAALPPSRAEREAHLLARHGTYHHGVGTCAMGSADDPMTVVDPTLRLRGIDNLWIADASVLPTIPRANTNLAAVMVGEIAARTSA